MTELLAKNESKGSGGLQTAPVAVAEIDVQQLPALSSPSQLVARSIVPYMHYGVRKLGRSGVIGIALCAFSAALLISSVMPLRQQVALQENELADARALHRQKPDVARSGSRAGTVDQLVRNFPSRDDLPEVLRQIVVVAGAAGLALETGSYEVTGTEADSIDRYRLKLPIRGTYPEIRQFIENTLAALPAVALESMQVQRNEVADSIVSADLQFAVLVRNQP